MSDSQIDELVRRLHTGTRNGKVSWEVSARSEPDLTYKWDSNHGSVRVALHSLTIYNDRGTAVKSLDERPDVRDLWYLIGQKREERVIELIDAILKDLEARSPQG